jgi:hypothetical protein
MGSISLVVKVSTDKKCIVSQVQIQQHSGQSRLTWNHIYIYIYMHTHGMLIIYSLSLFFSQTQSYICSFSKNMHACIHTWFVTMCAYSNARGGARAHTHTHTHTRTHTHTHTHTHTVTHLVIIIIIWMAGLTHTNCDKYTCSRICMATWASSPSGPDGLPSRHLHE